MLERLQPFGSYSVAWMLRCFGGPEVTFRKGQLWQLPGLWEGGWIGSLCPRGRCQMPALLGELFPGAAEEPGACMASINLLVSLVVRQQGLGCNHNGTGTLWGISRSGGDCTSLEGACLFWQSLHRCPGGNGCRSWVWALLPELMSLLEQVRVCLLL